MEFAHERCQRARNSLRVFFLFFQSGQTRRYQRHSLVRQLTRGGQKCGQSLLSELFIACISRVTRSPFFDFHSFHHRNLGPPRILESRWRTVFKKKKVARRSDSLRDYANELGPGGVVLVSRPFRSALATDGNATGSVPRNTPPLLTDPRGVFAGPQNNNVAERGIERKREKQHRPSGASVFSRPASETRAIQATFYRPGKSWTRSARKGASASPTRNAQLAARAPTGASRDQSPGWCSAAGVTRGRVSLRRETPSPPGRFNQRPGVFD